MEELRDADLAIGVKTKQILKLLEKKGYVHEQVVHPTLLAVHKENRSGMMVNCWDVHAKGYEALRVGWNMKKLAESYCFEVSHARREEQLKPMKLLVEAADGLLAPCGGTERFLSVSSSHMSQFVRAVHAGCRTEDENLAGINKTLSLESLMQEFEDPAFEAAVGEGWAWSCISSAVEDAAPWLPQLLQAALNSSNHIGRQATEIEVAMLLAYHFGKTKCMETSTQLASAWIPLKYVEAVAHIVQHYGGGPQFPLVKLLGDIEKLFCTSLMLGTDFTHAIAYTDFGSKESTFPLVRMMLVACNLSSNKQEDGFARLLVKSDVDKLKAPSQKENLMLAEKQARLVISQLGEDVFQKENVKLLARFLPCGCARKKAKVAKPLCSEVWQPSTRPLRRNSRGRPRLLVPQVLGPRRRHRCRHCRREKKWVIESCAQDTSNPAAIAALKYSWLCAGKNYVRKDQSRVFTYKEMTGTHARFQVLDIWGQELLEEIPHEDLKHFRLTEKNVPRRLEDDVVRRLQMENRPYWAEELEKAQVYAGVLSNYKERLGVVMSRAWELKPVCPALRREAAACGSG